jgi:hypothetical protein
LKNISKKWRELANFSFFYPILKLLLNSNILREFRGQTRQLVQINIDMKITLKLPLILWQIYIPPRPACKYNSEYEPLPSVKTKIEQR